MKKSQHLYIEIKFIKNSNYDNNIVINAICISKLKKSILRNHHPKQDFLENMLFANFYSFPKQDPLLLHC